MSVRVSVGVCLSRSSIEGGDRETGIGSSRGEKQTHRGSRLGLLYGANMFQIETLLGT